MKSRATLILVAIAFLAAPSVYGQSGTNCCNNMAIAGQTGPYCTTPPTQVAGNPSANPPQQAGSYCPLNEVDTNLSCTSTDPTLKSGTSCGSVPTNKAQAKGAYGWDSSGNFIACNGTYNPIGPTNAASSTGQASTFNMEATSYSGVTNGQCVLIQPVVSYPSACPTVACASSSGGGGGGGGCTNCKLNCDPCDGSNGGTCCSPVLIDTTGRGFFLTDASNGVMFDIGATGTPIQMAWTAAGSGNAFLVLPEADGLVHSGRDLFGSGSPQPPSAHPSGFAALAVYDQPANGGNGDGIIDSRDAIFSSLRLWIDANHDGISQPEELHTLPSLGVNSISLTYKLTERTDQYGNYFRYHAVVNPGDPANVGRAAYDVFFRVLSTTGSLRKCPAIPSKILQPAPSRSLSMK